MRDSGLGWLENTYPLADLGMSRRDCLGWFERRYPGRPLVKSSCVGCPFHSDQQWLRLTEEDPEGMAAAVALDYRLRDPDRPQNAGTRRLPEFLHKSCEPLDLVLARLKRSAAAGEQLPLADGFGNDCEGVCGV